jgi:hypothetical protein
MVFVVARTQSHNVGVAFWRFSDMCSQARDVRLWRRQSRPRSYERLLLKLIDAVEKSKIERHRISRNRFSDTAAAARYFGANTKAGRQTREN